MTLTFPSPARLALIAALAGSCSLSALAQAQPQTPLRTGEAVYQSICIACHATPRAWRTRPSWVTARPGSR